jgi:hypothetical protein
MKDNMKGGNFLSSLGKVGSAAAGAAGIDTAAIQKSVLASVQKTVLSPDNPLGAAVEKATKLTGKVANVVEAVKSAPDTIAQAAATAVESKIVEKLGDAGLENPTAQGASGSLENLGTPSTNDPGSIANNGVTSGGGYETVYLTKPLKDPLHVFYLYGKPIYFTDNGKGRVKIVPIHVDMQMAKTSSRHKYSKKIKRVRKHKSTKKQAKKGVRKTSRRTKQRHSRRR